MRWGAHLLEIAFVIETCLFGKDFGGPDGGERKRDGDPGHAEVDPGAEVGVVRACYCCYSWMEKRLAMCAEWL